MVGAAHATSRTGDESAFHLLSMWYDSALDYSVYWCYQNFHRETDKQHQKLQSGKPHTGPRIEAGTSRIRNKSCCLLQSNTTCWRGQCLWMNRACALRDNLQNREPSLIERRQVMGEVSEPKGWTKSTPPSSTWMMRGGVSSSAFQQMSTLVIFQVATTTRSQEPRIITLPITAPPQYRTPCVHSGTLTVYNLYGIGCLVVTVHRHSSTRRETFWAALRKFAVAMTQFTARSQCFLFH
jgi:hypothetical protein